MSSPRFIPVASPVLNGREKEYVLDCIETNWISSSGRYVDRFESAFAEFCGVRHAIACCNGTVALHLALLAAGIGPGDEVLVPTLTFVATANAVTYCGATPVFVDCEPDTWNLDPQKAEPLITRKTKAIVPVHLYGLPCDMSRIRELADRRGLCVIEDAAEAHGARYRGQRAGSLGDVGVFSFYGNKIITTGEGGMVTTNDDSIAAKARMLKGQGMDPHRRYWFPIVGYNYRMTNLAAAIGLGQLERIEWHLARHVQVAAWYFEELGGIPGLSYQQVPNDRFHAYWMYTILVEPTGEVCRDSLMTSLAEAGIETRPVFFPVHALPAYARVEIRSEFPVAEFISSRGLSLPTWSGLTREDVQFVCSEIRRFKKA